MPGDFISHYSEGFNISLQQKEKKSECTVKQMSVLFAAVYSGNFWKTKRNACAIEV